MYLLSKDTSKPSMFLFYQTVFPQPFKFALHNFNETVNGYNAQRRVNSCVVCEIRRQIGNRSKFSFSFQRSFLYAFR